jgi:hypothetical protein
MEKRRKESHDRSHDSHDTSDAAAQRARSQRLPCNDFFTRIGRQELEQSNRRAAAVKHDHETAALLRRFLSLLHKNLGCVDTELLKTFEDANAGFHTWPQDR